MKPIQYTILFIAAAILGVTDLKAQEQEKPDSTNVYIGQAIDRSQIDPEELPQEILDSLKSSKFAEMEMVAVYKLDIVPGKETATDSTMREAGPESDQRPYTMRSDDMDIEETYYEDTYDDVLEEDRQREGTAQENATDTDITKDTDPTREDQVTQKQKPDNVDTYYEIEVNGSADAYVLLFSENGQLTHTLPQDM